MTQDNTEQDIDTPPPSPFKPKGIPIEDILYCVDTLKLSHQQAADRIGCDKSNITKRLQDYGYKHGDIEALKKHDADKYTIRRYRINKHLTEDKLEKMSAYQLVGMDNITLQQERLIRGESTSNLEMHVLSGKIDEIASKRKALALELGIDES